MKCPICVSENLVMTDRQGIEIDYCPQCRGVWLDRGELDKIIERSGPSQPQSRNDYQEQSRYAGEQGYHKKKKSSILGELFDF